MPLVIVPPLAVNMLIYDLFPERSLVKYFLARGFDVYLIDWGQPNRGHTHYNLHTYVADFMPDFLAKVRKHSGQKELSLHGWSMGGIFTLSYTALTHDPDIRNLIIIGTPLTAMLRVALVKFINLLSVVPNGCVKTQVSVFITSIHNGFTHRAG